MAEKPETASLVSYSRQYRRCGKPGCVVCGPGQPGHGPYWYAYWREDGRTRSRYLGRVAPPGVADAPASPDTAGAAASPRPALRVRTLGGFAVWLGDKALPVDRWQRSMAGALFKALLGAPGHRLTRDQVIELLWPDAAPEQGATRLRVTVHRLRQALGAARLAYHGDMLTLAPGAAEPVWLDADAFETAAAAALAGGDLPACRAALALYGGEYLPEDRYAEWAVERREALGRQWLDMLLHAAALCEEAGEVEEAERHLQNVLAADRCHETAAYRLMQLQAHAGRTAQALRVYRRLADGLRDELNLAPEPRTRALHQALTARRQTALPAPPEPARMTNLPAPATSFIGRRRELAAIRALLTEHPPTDVSAPDPDGVAGDQAAPCRLLTLVGPGGVGKTRLALAAADDVLDQFPDGVWLADLAPLAEPALVVGTVLRAMNLAEAPGRAPLDILTAAARDKRILILLDNCEHVIDACAVLASGLLAFCPAMRILATSRERLAVAGERTLPIAPLTVPDAADTTAARLPCAESARLFLERARAQRPELVLTDQNAPVIAQICTRLAGIPLALELAAARMGVLSLEGIAARLDESLRLLAGGPRSALPRQRTLRATLDWSWDLLEERERMVLRRLAVCAGGCVLAAAAAICAGDSIVPEETVLDALAGLERKSLLQLDERAGEARYGLLETVRQYGLERLAEAGETDGTRERHAAYYLWLAAQADEALRGPEQARWLARLEVEHHNFRAVLTWLRERGDAHRGLLLAGILTRFWQPHGYVTEGRRWSELFLACPPVTAPRTAEDQAVRARALRGAGILAVAQGDYPAALAWYEESLALLRGIGDRRGVAMVLNNQALVFSRQGELRRAEAVFAESLALLRALDDRPLVAMSLNNLAAVARSLGDLSRAAALHEEALGMQRALGDTGNAADSLFNLGVIASDQGRYQAAWTLFEESLSLHRTHGNQARIALVLHGMGTLAVRWGEYDRAGRLFEEALALRKDVGDRSGVAHSVHGLGVVAQQQGDYARARQLVEEGLAMRRALGERAETILPLSVLALIAAHDGEYRRADACFEEGTREARATGSRAGLAGILQDQGWVAIWRGDHARAAPLFLESLTLQRELGDRFAIANCLEGLAAVVAGQGRPERAATLLGAAAALRDTLGVPLLPILRDTHERASAAVSAALGADAFHLAWRHGEGMTVAQASMFACDRVD